MNDLQVGWISVKEQLPPVDKHISSSDCKFSIDVCIVVNGYFTVGYFTEQGHSKKWFYRYIDPEDNREAPEPSHWAYITPTTTPHVEVKLKETLDF